MLFNHCSIPCNVFYYQLGYNMGIDSNGNYDSDLGTDKLRKYAAMYGLDRKSGVEIPEACTADI